jgi:glutamine cyclotransferase
MRRLAIALALLMMPAVATAQVTAPAAVPPAEQAPPARTPVPIYGFEVVRAWPHDRQAFTQGLVWHRGEFLESTGRHPSTVRRVRVEDGQVLVRRTLDDRDFGEGLTEIDGRVLTLTWTGEKGFIWDPADLSLKGEFAYRGEGWGLTDDGSRVILSDGSAWLRFFDPATMAETGRVPVTLHGEPIDRLNELEWIDGEVWANVWQTDFIVRIDPSTGHIVGLVDLEGLLPDRTGMTTDDVLNGIAWDPQGRRLFVTGKNWPNVFEIRLTEPVEELR